MAPSPAQGFTAHSVGSVHPATASSTQAFTKNGNGNGKAHGVQLRLQPILENLPSDLRHKAIQTEVGETRVFLPVEKIFPQLGRGVVKITFGELRTAAPGTFLSQSDQDQVQIVLPLAEILAELNPTLLTRRPAKTKIQIPDNVRSPFDSRGQGAVFAVGTGKVQPLTPPTPRENTPVIPKPVEIVNNRSTFLSVQPPVAPMAKQPSSPPPVEMPKPPVAKPHVAPPLANPQIPPIARQPASAPPVHPPIPPVAKQPVNAPPVIPDAPVLRMVTPRVEAPEPTLPPKVPTPAPMPMPPPAAEVEPITFVPAEPAAPKELLTVSLAALLGSLAGKWPETVRSDIVRMNLMSAKVELPVDVVEPALKRGRVPLKWATLRSWLKPAPLLNMSQHDDVIVELPLNILAPLFIERQRKAENERRKVAIDDTIPDLFFGLPQSDTPLHLDSCSVTRPSDTNFMTKPHEELVTPPVPEKTPDTNFYAQSSAEAVAPMSESTEVVKQSHAPKDIVLRAASLQNVAGALIALPDGLMVAGQIPPDLNGDTLAAFVPQIFNKLNQSCAELRMGEVNNVAFTVGNVPWKIFRVNAVFFAAFGRASMQIPTAQLASLAAELNQKNY